MHQLRHAHWHEDWSRLPTEAQAGFLSSDTAGYGTVIRLSASYFAVRLGQGAWHIGTALEILPHILSWPIPEPYAPPARQVNPVPIATDLLKELGF